MSDDIKSMNLPWKDKPKRGGLLRTMERIGDIVRSDVNRVNRAFQPLLCDAQMLDRHAAALGIPALDEAVERRRDRVSAAAYFLAERGQRGQVFDVLNLLVPGRYEVVELPQGGFRVGFSKIGVDRVGSGNVLVVKVRELTGLEKTRISDVLDFLLDPDIEIVIVPWVVGVPKNLTMAQIRLYGGSRWLSTQFNDIGDRIDTRVLPDDAFRIGRGRVGYAVVWGSITGERVRIHCADRHRAAVTERATRMFADAVNWEVASSE